MQGLLCELRVCLFCGLLCGEFGRLLERLCLLRGLLCSLLGRMLLRELRRLLSDPGCLPFLLLDACGICG